MFLAGEIMLKQTQIHVILKLFSYISITLEQTRVFKTDVIAELTYNDLASKKMEDSGRIEYYEGQQASN